MSSEYYGNIWFTHGSVKVGMRLRKPMGSPSCERMRFSGASELCKALTDRRVRVRCRAFSVNSVLVHDLSESSSCRSRILRGVHEVDSTYRGTL